MTAVAFLLLFVDYLVLNLHYYFFALRSEGLREASLVSHIFPAGTIRRLIYISALFLLIWVGVSQPRDRPSPIRELTPGRRLLIFLTGALGAAAWLKSYDFLYREFMSVSAALGLDAKLSSLPTNGTMEAWTPDDYDVTLQLPHLLLTGAAEECMYAALTLLSVRHLKLRPAVAITCIAILRGTLHLHLGTIFSLLFFLPLGIFAAWFFLKTRHLLPLIVGHVLYNYLTLSAPPMPYSSVHYILKVSALPVAVLGGYLLTLVVFPRLPQWLGTDRVEAVRR